MTPDWDKVRHFKPSEFACKCGACGSNGDEMDPHFITALDNLRERLGFPLIVTSGYRCPAYNQQVSTTGADGPHTTGRAVDFGISGARAHALVTETQLGMTGIGINQKGPHEKRFIHLDNLKAPRPRPNIWSY